MAQLLRTCLQSIPTAADRTGIEDPEPDPTDNNNDSTTSKAKSRKRKSKNSSSTGSAKRRKMEWTADSYHAGMSAAQRKTVQNGFMSGKVRIVVATVAFGMGLNKANVRAIIHYNMPKSFESFVQEIGRAGRDGLPAYCHIFIDKEVNIVPICMPTYPLLLSLTSLSPSLLPFSLCLPPLSLSFSLLCMYTTKGSDIHELRRHAYSNTVDPYTVKQLVRKAFTECQCQARKQLPSAETPPTPPTDSTHHSTPCTLRSPRWCAGHEVAIPIEAMVQSLDVREECVSTLLCYLELKDWLEVLNVVNDSCTLKCYGGARQLRALAQKVPAVAAAAARLREKGEVSY